jgi:FkbM family methyltransferase
MPFISYAQNYEDVILWRALRDVRQGFYVDIGAADPEELSVTRAFYDRGWSGVNVEPLDEYFEKLKQARPRDTNLKVAVGREAGIRTLYAIAGTGLSTFDPKIAARHQASGFQVCEIFVPVLTLAKILEDSPTSPFIHFLKIDVEGAEAEVLEGLNLDRVRPWIIIIEATEPFSTVSTRDMWEQLITDRGYGLAYFDGLNCFYVADEVAALKERLAVPPNFFDDFVRFPEWAIRQEAAKLEQELVSVRANTETIRKESAGLHLAVEIERNHSADLHLAVEIERNHSADLHLAVEIERNYSATLKNALEAKQVQVNALEAKQVQVANLTSILEAERSQLDRLIISVQRLEAQSVLPSIDRAVGRIARGLQERGDRLTGGGMRAFANRLVTSSLERTTLFLTRLATLTRSALKPFSKSAAKLTPPAVYPDAVVIEQEAAATIIDLLPTQPQRVKIYVSRHRAENVIVFETNADGVKPKRDTRNLFFNVRMLSPMLVDSTSIVGPVDGFSSLETDGQFPHVWAIAHRAELKVPTIAPTEHGPVPFVFELSTLNARSVTITLPVCDDTNARSPDDSAIMATLPASVRSTYLKLKATLLNRDS